MWPIGRYSISAWPISRYCDADTAIRRISINAQYTAIYYCMTLINNKDIKKLRPAYVHLKLPTLKYRRLCGDMIEVFKITHNTYDSEVSPELRYYPKSNTRGNKYKLLNHTFHYDTWKYSFSARIVNIWINLPNFAVDVDTVCLFKARLDKFWMHQDVIYDFTTDLTGIGDRSVCKSSWLKYLIHRSD